MWLWVGHSVSYVAVGWSFSDSVSYVAVSLSFRSYVAVGWSFSELCGCGLVIQ